MAERQISGEQASGPVLVYLPDRGIGDLMWHLPTIRAIAGKTPGGKVVLAARPSTRAAEVLAAEPSIGRIDYLTYHAGAFKQVREVADFYRLCRRLKPSAVWILEKIGRPAQAAFFAGVPERHGFGLGHASQERWLSRGPRLPKSMRPAHRLEKLAAFEASHGLTLPDREPALKIDPRPLEAIRQRYADRPRPWAVFGPGASEPHRCWPAESFAKVAEGLADEVGTFFWLGGPQDAERFAVAIAASAQPEKSVVACDLTLDAAAALLSDASVFLGNDSGPLNLAAAVGVPAVGLYGTSPPLLYSKWLEALVAPTKVLADVTPEEAIQALRRNLARKRA